jgi:L-seryl-tRNA(Ser) seleniumtransferase
MMTTPVSTLRIRAERIVERAGVGSVTATHSVIGAGSASGVDVPSIAIELHGDYQDLLRKNSIPIIARVSQNKTFLDLRTIAEDDDNVIIEALQHIP